MPPPRRPRRRAATLEAAALYARCLALDPADAVAAFNRANCLRAAGRQRRRSTTISRAIKLDRGFVEAWFNLAGLMAERGRAASARRHLADAPSPSTRTTPTRSSTSPRWRSRPATSPRRGGWWQRYLELDSDSRVGADRRRAACGSSRCRPRTRR